jgi:predicted transcriptional regulator
MDGMAKVVSVRVPEDLADWLDGYAERRGVKRGDLIATALAGFREDCESGVPELRRTAELQAYTNRAEERGVGDCPSREGDLGHVWGGGPSNACSFCGAAGRADHDPSLAPGEQAGHFAQATLARAELFSRLRQPQSVRGTTAAEKRS